MNTFSKAQQIYIDKKDIEGAYDRFQRAYKNWKEHWWNVITTLYEKFERIRKNYKIDFVNRVVEKIIKRGRKKAFYLDEVLTFECDAHGVGAYVVRHYDDRGRILWTKVGKAEDAQKRLAQHFQGEYKENPVSGVCLKWFPAKNENHALSIENILRDHFQKKGYNLIGNDRFTDLYETTEQDWEEINAKLEVLETLF